MECEHMAEQLHPEDIYQTLEYEIVTLKIKPGETISENQLCKRFGISRTPVRTALQRLEQNGFVQIIPCKGTIVTPINLDIVDQLKARCCAISFRSVRPKSTSKSSTNMTCWKRWPRP